MSTKIITLFALIVTRHVCAVSLDNVNFYLYTTSYLSHPIELKIGMKEGFDLINVEKKIKILCHGFQSNYNTHWVYKTKVAYIETGEEENIIAVNWEKDAVGVYSHAVKSVQSVGEHMGNLILHLHSEKNIPLTNFHLIGHSLGAHISGFAGQKVFSKTGNKVGRITGLDPAGPAFNVNGIDERLSSDDALFVDAIHTDTKFLGYRKSMAHADFWPNGGASQPGCSIFEAACNHGRAPIYFYESIYPMWNFFGWPCKTYESYLHGKCEKNKKVKMGNRCEPDTRGDFYFQTNRKSPFAMSHYYYTAILR